MNALNRGLAILLGAALVAFLFPKHQEEKRLLETYRTEDEARIPSCAPAPARASSNEARETS